MRIILLFCVECVYEMMCIIGIHTYIHAYIKSSTFAHCCFVYDYVNVSFIGIHYIFQSKKFIIVLRFKREGKIIFNDNTLLCYNNTFLYIYRSVIVLIYVQADTRDSRRKKLFCMPQKPSEKVQKSSTSCFFFSFIHNGRYMIKKRKHVLRESEK